MARRRKALKVVGIAFAAIAVVAAGAILVYRDDNLNTEERLIAKAY